MQDVQNIPNPDTSSTNQNDEFGSHSDLHPENQQGDIETPGTEGDVGETIPNPKQDDFPSQEDPTVGESESDLL